MSLGQGRAVLIPINIISRLAYMAKSMMFGHGNYDDDGGYFADDDNDVVVVLTALLIVGSDLLGSLRFLELKRKLARLLQAHVRAQFDLRVTRI